MTDEIPEPPEETPPEEEKKKPPSKPRRRKTVIPKSKFFDEELERSNDELHQTFHHALENHLANTLEGKKKELKNLKALDSLLMQYLDSFIVIGYDTSGEYVSLVNAHNEQSADSLSTGLHKFITNNINRGSNPFPPFI